MKELTSRAAFCRGYRWFLNLFGFIGILSLFISFEWIFSGITCWFLKLVCIVFSLIFVYALLHYISFHFHNKQQKDIKLLPVLKLGSDKKLFILFGDLLGKDIAEQENRVNIVIPFNRCFDIEVDDVLISRNSLHGKLVEKLLDSEKYDKTSLRETITASLRRISNQNYVPEIVDKQIGEKLRYPIGAIASIPGVRNEYYFCFGLSKFNQDKAETTRSEYVNALDRLIKRIIDLSQGYSVYIPLIGTGLSGTGVNNELALEILINTIKLYEKQINCNIFIVLKEELKPLLEKITPYV